MQLAAKVESAGCRIPNIRTGVNKRTGWHLPQKLKACREEIAYKVQFILENTIYFVHYMAWPPIKILLGLSNKFITYNNIFIGGQAICPF